MSSVDGMAAARTLLGFTNITPRSCLHYVWRAYRANGAQPVPETYPHAQSAWEATRNRRTDRHPPAGFPVWLGTRPGIGGEQGDIVISLGGGRVAATDWPVYGVVGECTIDQRVAQTGRPYLGWADNILGNPIESEEYMNAEQQKKLEGALDGIAWIKRRIGGSWTSENLTNQLRAVRSEQAEQADEALTVDDVRSIVAGLVVDAGSGGLSAEALAAAVDEGFARAIDQLTFRAEVTTSER